ncbi:MAG TPA: pyrroline-5-carboxylate reductase [Planctomycetaceae bacterium]|jgi:pyrroline-5-carboxylate reductase|nr:pyrroline-5-carboxylate reductase [Planctomycetaceae bacterium]
MKQNVQCQHVGFIGAGKMATALAQGLCRAGMARPEDIAASDVIPAARQEFAAQTGGTACDSNREIVERADILVLAVKPQHFRGVLTEISPHLGPRHLVISIAAGIPLATMTGVLGPERRLVRVMPNTPCLVGASASAYCLGGAATAEDGNLVEQLLSAVGMAVALPEPLLDAVTGLSGSGPAFVCLVIEALADGGVKAGLSREVALKLAAQTVLGTARMVLETGQHPAVLKDAVASPAGTTIAGLHELERGGLRGCLMNAVDAAARRSRELAQSQ